MGPPRGEPSSDAAPFGRYRESQRHHHPSPFRVRLYIYLLRSDDDDERASGRHTPSAAQLARSIVRAAMFFFFFVAAEAS